MADIKMGRPSAPCVSRTLAVIDYSQILWHLIVDSFGSDTKEAQTQPFWLVFDIGSVATGSMTYLLNRRLSFQPSRRVRGRNLRLRAAELVRVRVDAVNDGLVIMLLFVLSSLRFAKIQRLSTESHMSWLSTMSSAASVTGIAWDTDVPGSPRVSLFTKAGCTLCDEARVILESCRKTCPHSLELVDITDADKREWWERYKYDIPVLHIDGVYWAKHRISSEEAQAAILTATKHREKDEPFPASRGQPDASRLERS